MRATIPFVKKVYEEYNQKCFGGILPTPEYRISNTKNIWGNVRWWHRHDETGKIVEQTIGLGISKRYDISEERLIDIIIHEMIHIYIIVAGIPITATHGPEFEKVVKEINKKYGRHVESRKEILPEELDSDTVREPHHLCYIELEDGRKGIMAFTPKKTKQIKAFFAKTPSITKHVFYFSDDPFFNRFWVHSSFKNIGLWTDGTEKFLKMKGAKRIKL
jgi:hypothetical protein